MFVYNINILYIVVCLFMQHSDIYEDILTYKHMYIPWCYKPRQMTFLCNYKRTYVLTYILTYIYIYIPKWVYIAACNITFAYTYICICV